MEEEQKTEGDEKISEETKDYSKTTKMVLLGMAVLLASTFIVYYISMQQKNFEINGMAFTAEDTGNMRVYKSLIGYVTSAGDQIPFTLQLRTNPKELMKISSDGKINLKDKTVISVSPEIGNCSRTYMTMIDMSMTLSALGKNVSAATTDINYSNETGIPYIDCAGSVDKSVIIFKESNTTSIHQNSLFSNCYIVEVKDCEMTEAYERLLLAYIADSMIVQ